MRRRGGVPGSVAPAGLARHPPAWHPPGPEPLYAAGIRVLDAWVRTRYRLAVRGLGHLPPTGAALLAANHVSFEDPVVLGVAAHRAGRKMRAVAVAGAFAHPFAGWALRRGHQIPLHRGHGDDALASARAALEAGEVVLIYPEGTIPPPGERVRARRGIGRLALATGAPIVPAASWGLGRAGEGQRRRQVRAPAGLVVGPPIAPGRVLPHGDARPKGRLRSSEPEPADAAQRLADEALRVIRRQLPAARRLAGV